VFRDRGLRVWTDFVTRPPRIEPDDLAEMWAEQEGRDPPFIDARRLAERKKTNRERDYAVIGELARLLEEPRDQLLLSRSARDLKNLSEEELFAWWDRWLEMAQATNDVDEHTYSHGVFTLLSRAPAADD